MKNRWMSIIVSVVGLTLTAAELPRATVEDPGDPSGEVKIKTTTTTGFLSDLWDVVASPGLTNISLSLYGTYTPSIKEWGGGFTVDRNIPLGGGVGTGVALGVDWYAREFYSVSGQTKIDYATRPLVGFGGWATNVIVTPFGRVGIGTPFGDQATETGTLEVIASTGMKVLVVKFLGGELEAGGIVGTRTGLGEASGWFYGLEGSWRKRW